MELWIVITIAAAFLQNIRSSLQRHLKGHMGTTGATFVRFGFGLPFAALYLFLLAAFTGAGWTVVSGGGGVWMWPVTTDAGGRFAATPTDKGK